MAVLRSTEWDRDLSEKWQLQQCLTRAGFGIYLETPVSCSGAGEHDLQATMDLNPDRMAIEQVLVLRSIDRSIPRHTREAIVQWIWGQHEDPKDWESWHCPTPAFSDPSNEGLIL